MAEQEAIISEFIKFSKENLTEILLKNGTVLYSSKNTLRKGDYYILGLNPGGSSNRGTSILNSLTNLPDYEHNAYLHDEPWEDKYEVGGHPLQKGLKALCNYLEIDLENILASNLIFFRTPNDKSINFQDADNCWIVHEKLLSIVQPKIIISFGNGRISPFQYIINNYPATNFELKKTKHPRYNAKILKTKILNLDLLIIGLPHLSRYYIAYDVEILKWLKKNINKYLEQLP